MEARRSARRGILVLLRLIPCLCDSSLIVRPEGAHSELSQKADLAAFFFAQDCPLRIGGFGALCNPETSLWVTMPRIEGITRGFKRHLDSLVWKCCCGEVLLSELLKKEKKKKGPRKTSRTLVGGEER